jgi:Na+:H+ antiporter, NhaA family
MTVENTAPPIVRLPGKPLTRIVKPITRFLQIEAASGIALIAASAVALLLANSNWAADYRLLWATPLGFQVGAFELELSVKQVINEGLMTLFFFVVGLEIKRELALGELRKPHVAAFPIAAALGGMAVPAALYLALQAGQDGERGWGIVMATDIAFVVGCLAVLGPRVPQSLRVFVLSLAIIDDIGAVLVIALAYSSGLQYAPLALAVVLIGVVLILQRLGVRSVAMYVMVGLISWLAVHESGIHPTIVGVVLGLLTPVHAWIGRSRLRLITRRVSDYLHGGPLDEAEENAVLRSVALAARESLSPLQRLEMALHPWVNFAILPLFALANAGIELSLPGLGEPIVLAVGLGLVLGKPLGILAACWTAVQLGFAASPRGLNWPRVLCAGILCGIGFTMSLFIADLAFEAELLMQASLGVLVASATSGVLGLASLWAVLRNRG